MATKNPKAILDNIVKDGEVKDVMLLRKAAVAFTSLLVKGYVGNRFACMNRLKTDMVKENSIPASVMTQVQSSMETGQYPGQVPHVLGQGGALDG